MQSQRVTEHVEQITDRQREVARLVAEGRSNPEIAEALGISLAGAKYHVSELLGRLGVERRQNVADWYREHAGPVVPARSRWSRLRALWPLGALAAVGVPLAVLAVALANGRAEVPPDATPTATLVAMATATEITEPTPVPTEPASPSTDRMPIFFAYEVREGDTLAEIASRFGVGEDDVIWNNPDVEDAKEIMPGQILQIPSVPGILHSVRVNETVTAIAARYDADWRDIVEFKANGFRGDPNNLVPGSLILVPGGRVMPLTVGPPPRPGASTSASADMWMWPVAGTLIAPFGPLHPEGIDIGAAVGTPIVAASSGTATFVGGNPCCDSGYHVIIDHGDGYETLYAHLSDFAVTQGQYVDAGNTIGWVGMTGRTEEPHVHFEIHRNGVYQDPLAYLP